MSVARTAAYSSRTKGRAISATSTMAATTAARRPGATTSARCSGSGVVMAPAGAFPSRPCGFNASTMAMTMNSATSVRRGKAKVMPKRSTSPNAMQNVLVTPISTAARKAPGIEPKPPTTVTTKASAMIDRSMPRLAGSRGNCNAPANPARKAPSTKTAVYSRDWSMPNADVSARFSAAARISMPKRVRVTSERQRDQDHRSGDHEEQVILRNGVA